MANCITLVRMVMAPTAISPPYRSRDELKQTVTILSLDCMIKAASPSAIQGRTTFASRWRCFFLRWSCVFLPQRNKTTQSVEIACEITVASAAPRTPIWKTKINTGSRTILQTAPIRTETMENVVNPCAVMNAFIPRVNCTNKVPKA